MNHSPEGAWPSLLLVEDDPVSAAFLRDAAAALPARVLLAGSVAEARTACGARRFDLLLIDANLPDGRGEELLRSLRESGIATAALAHTADAGTETHARLQAAGFAGVLCKPLGAVELQAALRRHLPDVPRAVWNDAAALAALGGRMAHVQALRQLFLDELPAQRDRIVDACGRGDEAGVRAELHRLAASCGFVGATRLGEAVRGMRDAPLERDALREVEAAIGELLVGAEAPPTAAVPL